MHHVEKIETVENLILLCIASLDLVLANLKDSPVMRRAVFLVYVRVFSITTFVITCVVQI